MSLALQAAGINFTCHWGQEYGMTNASLNAYFGNRTVRWQNARQRILTTPQQRAVFSTPQLQSLGLG